MRLMQHILEYFISARRTSPKKSTALVLPASSVISDFFCSLSTPRSSQDWCRHIGAPPLTKKRLISQPFDRRWINPVLDATWIWSPCYSEIVHLTFLSLYSFKYAERSKGITDWIDENSVSTDGGGCGLLEIQMWHRNQWLPSLLPRSSSLLGIHFWYGL